MLMSGQNRKDPFHVNRNVNRDNLNAVRNARLPRGAQSRSRAQYSTADFTGPEAPIIFMPYTGNIIIILTGEPDDFDQLLINNPFITGLDDQPIVLSKSSGSTIVTETARSPGLVVLELISPSNDDVLTVSVGRQTDPRNN